MYVLSHSSALEILRSPACDQGIDHLRVQSGIPPRDSFSQKALDELLFENPALEAPVHVMTPGKASGRAAQGFIVHRNGRGVPNKSLLQLNHGLAVCGPELVLAQTASPDLPLLTIELGFELCGTYRRLNKNTFVDTEDDIKYHQIPLTTSAKIKSFVDRARGTEGVHLLRKAAPFILNGSASPIETRLAMFFGMPMHTGGQGIGMPTMNHRIWIPESRRFEFKHDHYDCDIYWPKAKTAIEYDSDGYHGRPEKKMLDMARRNDLESLGIHVITIVPDVLSDLTELEKIAGDIRKRLGTRKRVTTNNYFDKVLTFFNWLNDFDNHL